MKELTVIELALIEEGEITQRFKIDQPVMNIGRNPAADICINNEAASGIHAKLYRKENVYIPGHIDIFIEDIESNTGLFVNGQKMQSSKLENNDEVTIASKTFKLISE